VQVRGLIARWRSGLLDRLSVVRPRDRGALPGRQRTRPTANGILGWQGGPSWGPCLDGALAVRTGTTRRIASWSAATLTKRPRSRAAGAPTP